MLRDPNSASRKDVEKLARAVDILLDLALLRDDGIAPDDAIMAEVREVSRAVKQIAKEA